MRMKMILPQTICPADQFLAGMLMRCGDRIDELETEIDLQQKTIARMSRVLDAIGKHLELRSSAYMDSAIRMDHSIYPDDDGYKEIVDMFELKLEEDE